MSQLWNTIWLGGGRSQNIRGAKYVVYERFSYVTSNSFNGIQSETKRITDQRAQHNTGRSSEVKELFAIVACSSYQWIHRLLSTNNSFSSLTQFQWVAAKDIMKQFFKKSKN